MDIRKMNMCAFGCGESDGLFTIVPNIVQFIILLPEISLEPKWDGYPKASLTNGFREIRLTATSAQGVRLVMALAEARSSLRYSIC